LLLNQEEGERWPDCLHSTSLLGGQEGGGFYLTGESEWRDQREVVHEYAQGKEKGDWKGKYTAVQAVCVGIRNVSSQEGGAAEKAQCRGVGGSKKRKKGGRENFRGLYLVKANNYQVSSSANIPVFNFRGKKSGQVDFNGGLSLKRVGGGK